MGTLSGSFLHKAVRNRSRWFIGLTLSDENDNPGTKGPSVIEMICPYS
jgi:hypothetical protein